ncbi:MAG: bifunctional nuclease family protein [Propionibacteriaceae bacterium]|nr:bifunctional nuclease family protein [Propionibacteriaceae bacterium]
MRSLEVLGVRLDAPLANPVLLLKDVDSERCLPIWIGAAEGAAIVTALEGLVPERPLTHDLFATVLEVLGQTPVRGEITSVSEGVFYAELHLGDDLAISARPSDVVALAVRMGFPLCCPEHLLAEAGVELSRPERDEVELFREFLDSVNADDFEGKGPSQ